MASRSQWDHMTMPTCRATGCTAHSVNDNPARRDADAHAADHEDHGELCCARAPRLQLENKHLQGSPGRIGATVRYRHPIR